MRNQDTTKHDYGHALLVAGAYGRMGCAILAARAALRSGCGLVSVHLPERCIDPMQSAFPEAMVDIDPHPTQFSSVPEHLERYAAIAVGPGIGTDPTTAKALFNLLKTVRNLHHPFTPPHSPSLPLTPLHFLSLPLTPPHSPSLPSTPLILDADALNILSLHKEWLTLVAGAILTPHAREYKRLFGDADPAEMATKHGCFIVQKAHHTHVYSPDGQIYENHTGNAGMATAGSGDVLTGILLGMLSANCLRASVYEIVCKGVEIHGKIGDIAIEKQSESSLIASDLVENLKNISTDITAS